MKDGFYWWWDNQWTIVEVAHGRVYYMDGDGRSGQPHELGSANRLIEIELPPALSSGKVG